MKQKQLTAMIEEGKIDHLIWLINDLQRLLQVTPSEDNRFLSPAISETVDQIKRVAFDMKAQAYIDKFGPSSCDINDMNNVAVTSDDFNSLAICAFRYAFGRRTYITKEVADIINAHLNDLDNRTLAAILMDFDRAHESEAVGLDHVFGDDCDRNEWIKLENRLRVLHQQRSELYANQH